MKRSDSLYCIVFCCSFLLTTSFGVSETEIWNEPHSMPDTLWKVKPLARLGDPAPETGGTFLQFGEYHCLKSGIIAFWAKYGEDKKDWALYTIKEGKTRLVINNLSELPGAGDGKDEPMYTADVSGEFLLFSFIKPPYDTYLNYGWDGEKFFRILGRGDKITVEGLGEIVVSGCVVSPIKYDTRMKVSFDTEKPDKKIGWLLYDGSKYSKLLFDGDELPGSGGIRIKNFMEPPLIFGDTALVRLRVENAPYKEAIFRITNISTEKILAVGDPHPVFPDKKVSEISDLNASGPDHCILFAGIREGVFQHETGSLLLYSNGKLKSIIGGFKDLQAPKGFVGYKVGQTLFINPNEDYVLIPVSLKKTDINTNVSGTTILSSTVPYAIYLYNGNNLVILSKDDLKVIFSPSPPANVRHMSNMKGAIIKLSPFSLEGEYFKYNLTNPVAIPVPELKTDGSEKFFLTSIIAKPDENHLIATTTQIVEVKKRIKETQISGFFELTKTIQ